MNIVVLTKKSNPAAQPLCFITPDNFDDKMMKACFPQKYLDRYHIHCIASDQPMVASELFPILKALGEDEE